MTSIQAAIETHAIHNLGAVRRFSETMESARDVVYGHIPGVDAETSRRAIAVHAEVTGHLVWIKRRAYAHDLDPLEVHREIVSLYREAEREQDDNPERARVARAVAAQLGYLADALR